MATQAYATQAARIGKLKGEILAHAVPVEVLGITGTQKKMPKNSSDTIVFRRWLPYGGATTNSSTINRWSVTASAHVLAEGVTPNADTLTPQDITAVLQQYGALYQFTNKTADLYEDDVPEEMKKQTGQRLGLVREIVRYGALKAGTNVYYGGTGTTRLTTNGKISLKLIRKVTKNILANHAKQITSVLAPSPNFATTSVEASFLVFVHSDAEPDIRDLPGFKNVADYGQRKPIHEMELGSCERFRFIVSPELAAYADAGAAIGTTGCYSTTGTSLDVYPFIVVGEDAWGQVALRGVDAIDPIWLPAGQKDKNDPAGQRGFVGGTFWHVSTILNQGWMGVVEAGVSDLA
jgi:N4-gp56 family major capsid protein